MASTDQPAVVVDHTDEPSVSLGAEHADSPTEVSSEGWKAVAKRVASGAKENHLQLNAAGVAFFAFLAVVPSLVALVSIYGLVGDADAIEARVEDLAGALPDEARQLIVQQLEGIVATGGGALTISLVVALAVALWSASTGMSYLVEAVNSTYGCTETRGFVAKRGLSLIFTLGALVFVVIAVGVITALPAVLSALAVPGALRWLIQLGVWPVVGVALAIGLAVLYRYGPDREPEATWRWVSPGSVFAVVAWLIASIGFQVYVTNFGSYNETYGSLGAVVVALLWLWISALVVLVGAGINRELEAQTTVDTTV
jgi:membrane protein